VYFEQGGGYVLFSLALAHVSRVEDLKEVCTYFLNSLSFKNSIGFTTV
jgi:hypothetical protein